MAKFIVETSILCEIVIEAEDYEDARKKVDALEEKGLCWDHYAVDQTGVEIAPAYPGIPVTNLNL